MARLHVVLELGLIGLMLIWSVGAVVCALPPSRLRRALFRKNWGLWFANWGVFGAPTDRSEVCVYTLEFRDYSDAAMGEWREASRGRPWRWHSGLWQPERRIADRIHRIGQDIAFRLEHGTPAANWLFECRRLLETHLEAVRPRPASAKREIRLRMRRSICETDPADSAGAWSTRFEESVLLQFSASEPDVS